MARCQAYSRAEQWVEAAADASKVIELAPSGKKEHMLGYLRRG